MKVYQSKPILKKSEQESSSLDFKKVWFESVSITYLDTILGDNPSVSDGAPIAMGSRALDHEVVDVECFEATRPKSSRSNSELKVPVQHRAMILLKKGYSVEELAEMTQQVQQIQRQRNQSLESQKWDRVNEFAESSGKVFRKLTRLHKFNPAA